MSRPVNCRYCGSKKVRRSQKRAIIPIPFLFRYVRCTYCRALFRVPSWKPLPVED